MTRGIASDVANACMRCMSFNKGDVTPEEIIEFYTKILRGEDENFKSADSFKAAEFFIKYFGMLEKKDMSSGGVIIIDNIGREEDRDG